MNHIDEQTLELYVLGSEEIADLHASIEAHLDACAGCSALCRDMRDFYREAEEIRSEKAEATSRSALTVRSLLVKLPATMESRALNEIPKTLPARFILFVLRNPVKSSVGLLGVFAALLILLTPASLFKDANPAYVRATNEFLVVHNGRGDELWRMHVGMGYDNEVITRQTRGMLKPEDYLVTIDVNGDSRNEVLALFPTGDENRRSHIVCYGSDGTVLWENAFYRPLKVDPKTTVERFNMRQIVAGNLDRKDGIDIILVVAADVYAPSAILLLDAKTGSVKSEYWHPGHIAKALVHELGGNATKKILFVGENNALDATVLGVLDPAHLSGYALPAPPDGLEGFQRATEMWYIAFPKPDLAAIAENKRSVPANFRITNDSLINIDLAEILQGNWHPIMYFFDFSLKCLRVDENDVFAVIHKKLKAEGKLTKNLDASYYENLRRGVRYWNGETFVSKPVMNNKYLQAREVAKK